MDMKAAMKVVYVAGPYRASTEYQVLQNIRKAEEVALHVWRAGGEIVINIATLEITKAEDMSRRDSARAVEIVEENQRYLLGRWREIHG